MVIRFLQQPTEWERMEFTVADSRLLFRRYVLVLSDDRIT